jgi:amino acid transporter
LLKSILKELNKLDSLEKFGYEQKLKRTLSFRDVLVYGMIFMVPIAPMGIYGFIAPTAFNMVPFVYFIGICAMIFTALAYYRMSERFPISGSVYAYVQRAVNPHVGFLAGWTIMMDYIITPGLLYAMAGVWLGSLTPGISPWVWVLIFIVINTTINILGIEFTAKTNIVMLVIELIALGIFIVAGLAFVFAGGGMGGLSIEPIYQPGKIDPKFIAMATSIAVLSFLGFDGISTLAEETKNAQKTIGRATVAALLIMGALFIIQTYVAAIVAPDISALDPNIAFFQIAGIAGGPALQWGLTIVNIIAVGIANTLAAQAGMARVLFSMSRDGMVPTFLSKVHPKFKTPYTSTIFVAAFSIFVLLIFNLKIDILAKFINFGAVTSFIVLNLSVFWFFYIKEKRRDAKGTMNYLIFPLIGILILGFVWWGFDPLTKIVGFSWIAVGLIYGMFKSKFYKEVPEVFRNLDVKG